MQATADTLDLNPPDGGRWRGPMGLAFGVHLLLVLALTWGVSWQTDTVTVAEAELWSRLPQVAAPKLVAPEPPPEPRTRPAPRPVESPAEPPPPAAQAVKDAEIALARQREQEAKRQALRREAEAQRREQEKREQQAKDKAAAEKAAKEKAAKDKAAAQVQAEKAARDKADKAQKAAAAQLEAQLEADRKKNLERMMGQLGATGGPGAKGQAQQSSGPSASYAGKLVARIRPNIVFADTPAGNPRAEVEVRALPDGTIVGSKLLKSSGHRAWDDAVLRAVERTGKLPQDENGRVPGTLILGFRPQD